MVALGIGIIFLIIGLILLIMSVCFGDDLSDVLHISTSIIYIISFIVFIIVFIIGFIKALIAIDSEKYKITLYNNKNDVVFVYENCHNIENKDDALSFYIDSVQYVVKLEDGQKAAIDKEQ